ncbi:Clp protease N-terminal domain-containing protein [Nocardia mexicana]|uniref:ClpA/ClpB-like protein n=1 Tax=Nocardia mexicana TaxID=279262 RepID=A0A370H402_9NOCA|nr:Clp protease N-terminal domain-containing protein [Nocardia mexicana]RDI50634.1 ClpA/ClpB-like protein [Nocardia mexicana]
MAAIDKFFQLDKLFLRNEFQLYLHRIILRGESEARDDGSSSMEAQHLLLAIAAEPDPDTHPVLDSAGLDHRTVRAALDREFEASLAAVGVSAKDFPLPRASRGTGRPTMGASAKLALERTFTAAAKQDVRPVDLLLGVLTAEVGTVPRALALAGVDRGDLVARAQAHRDAVEK